MKLKLFKPCSKLLSKFKKLKPSPIKVRSRKRSFGCIPTKAVKFKKPFTFSQCRHKTKFRIKRTSDTRRKKSAKPHEKADEAAGEIEENEGSQVVADLASLGEAPFLLPVTALSPRNSSEETEELCRNSNASITNDERREEAIGDVKESCQNSSDTSITKDETSEDTEESGRTSSASITKDGSLEKRLVEMIMEEGKLKDLKDMEELLHCWRNLKSPIFINFVSRFYDELFLNSDES